MKMTFEIIQAIICALLLINIGIMFAAGLDRKSRRYAKEVIRETLRMKMLASRDLGKYALYVSPSCVKVALAGDHQLALLSGMNDFWDAVPEGSDRDIDLATAELEGHLNNGERNFALIHDCHGNTLVACRGYVVSDGYTCSCPAPEEVREIIRHAKGKAGGGK